MQGHQGDHAVYRYYGTRIERFKGIVDSNRLKGCSGRACVCIHGDVIVVLGKLKAPQTTWKHEEAYKPEDLVVSQVHLLRGRCPRSKYGRYECESEGFIVVGGKKTKENYLTEKGFKRPWGVMDAKVRARCTSSLKKISLPQRKRLKVGMTGSFGSASTVKTVSGQDDLVPYLCAYNVK